MRRKFAVLLAATLTLNSMSVPTFAAEEFEELPVEAAADGEETNEEEEELAPAEDYAEDEVFADDFAEEELPIDLDEVDSVDTVDEDLQDLAYITKEYTVTSPTSITVDWTGSVPDLSKVDELATITVTSGSETLTLTRGVDYTVEADTAGPDTGYVVFTTIGSLSGDIINQIVLEFNVEEDASAYEATFESPIYNGKALTEEDVKSLTTVIKDGNTRLTSDDFEFSSFKAPDKAKGDAGETYTFDVKVGKETVKKNASVTIQPLALSEDSDIVVNKLASLTYNAKEQKPEITAVTADEVALIADDYSISYNNNVNAGNKAEIIVTGSGKNVTGKGKAYFTIAPFDLAGAYFSVAEITSVPYNGEVQTPDVKANVKAYFENSIDATVIPADDYEVKYVTEDSIDADTYKIQLIPSEKNENLTGETPASSKDAYQITKANFAKDVVIGGDKEIAWYSQDTTAQGIVDEEYTLKINGHELTTDDYKVEFKTDNHSRVGKTTVLKFTGKGDNFDETSQEISYTVKAAELDDEYTSSVDTIIYDGTEKRPNAATLGNLSSKKASITPAKYIVTSWENNINASGDIENYPTAIIEGKDEYEGQTARVLFDIMPLPLSDTDKITVTGLAKGSYYEGAEITGATVTLNGKTLTADDFTLTADVVEDGYLTNVIVTGKGNYTKSVEITLDPKVASDVASLKDAVVESKIPAALSSYNPDDIKEFITVKVGNTVLPGENYEVEVISSPAKRDIKEKISYEITSDVVSGKKEVTQELVARDIADANFWIDDETEPIIYTGEKADLKGKTYVEAPDGATIDASKDYTVTCNDINAGEATATLTGKGNYTGTQTFSFNIQKVRLSKAEVDVPVGNRQFKAGSPADLSKEDYFELTFYDSNDNELTTDMVISSGTDYTVTLEKGQKIEKAGDVVSYKVEILEDSVNYYENSFVVSYEIVPLTVTKENSDVSIETPVLVPDEDPVVESLGEVVVTVDGTELKEDTDYTLSLEQKEDASWIKPDDKVSDEKEYDLLVEFKGNYSGKIRKELSVGTASFEINNLKLVKLSAKNLVYDGTAKTVTCNDIVTGATKVENDNRFTIVYTKQGETTELEGAPVDAGTYTATVTATKAYGGATGDSYTFTITPKAWSKSEFEAEAANIELRASETVAEVTYAGTNTQAPKCYEKSGDDYVESKVFTFVKFADLENGKAEIGLVEGGNYSYDGTYTKEFTLDKTPQGTITEESLEQLFVVEDVVYNGEAQVPTVKPADGSEISSDWIKVKGCSGDNTNATNAKVIFSVVVPESSKVYAAKTYGPFEMSFSILPASIDATTVADIKDQKETGEELYPTVVVKDANGALLTSGIDYTLKYTNNKDAGEATVTVTGRQNYKGTKTVSFNIVHVPETVKENEVAPTCTEAGSYDEVTKCSVCGEELSRETITVDALGHTAGEVVKENEKAATCTEAGSYDEVQYCTVCGAEIEGSRKTITVDALGHTAGEKKIENEVAATCTKEGSYDEVVYCSVDGVEMSRETKIVAALGHTAGEKKIENEVAATTTKEGSYDEVIYCSVCGEEISRTTITVPMLAKAPSAIALANKSATYNGKAIEIGEATVVGSTGTVTYKYYSDEECTQEVEAPVNAGTYYVKATVAEDDNYKESISNAAKLTIKKAAQKVTKATTSKTAKLNKTTTFKINAKSNGDGKVTYKKSSGSSKITVSKAGKVTIKKGLKKGTYKVKVKITIAASDNYKAKTVTKTLTIKVK